MALRLVRETSTTPNVTNKDDTIMTRYAYGGYNGVVKAFGSECEYTAESGIFKVSDGRIVIDGWEIDVDGAGWLLNLSNIMQTQYISIYAEINVLVESVKLDSTYLTGAYPEIDKGDNLTETPNGTARLLLYNVKVQGGTITEVIKRFEIIPYLTQKVLDLEKGLENFNLSLTGENKPLNNYDETKGTIEERLTRLGFKSGVIRFAGVDYGSESNTDTTQNGIYRLGNFVFGRIIISNSNLSLLYHLQHDSLFGNIPKMFRPVKDEYITIFADTVANFGVGFYYGSVLKIKTDGSYEIIRSVTDAGGVSSTYKSVAICFGYEAPPITD